MYLTYGEYLEMGGTLEESAFSRFAFGAERIIRRATQNRIESMKEIPEAVKWLVFELVGKVYGMAEGNHRLSAESVDSWSRSYQVQTEEEQKAAIDALVRNYLASETDDKGVPLLYLGVDTDVYT